MAGEVLAVGWTIVATLGGNRQITLHSAFAEDMAPEQKNAVIDDAMKIVDRQQAKAEKPEALKELHKLQDTLAQFREDRDRLETEHPAKIQRLQEELQRLEDPEQAQRDRDKLAEEMGADYKKTAELRSQVFNSGYTEFRNSGRAGEYKPQGNVRSNLERLDKALETMKKGMEEALIDQEVKRAERVDAIKTELQKAEAERHVALNNLAVSEKRYEAAIATQQARLDEIERALEG